jgi:type I restriction-modification system DNA methylase subunit
MVDPNYKPNRKTIYRRKNERAVEEWLLTWLKEHGFDSEKIGAGVQGTDDPILRDAIKSKTGKGGIGRPELVYPFNGGDVLLVECKADKEHHTSKETLTENDNLKKTAYAEDGVISYMKGARQKRNTLGLAVSGPKDNHRISWFRARRNGKVERLKVDKLLSIADCEQLLQEVKASRLPTKEEIQKLAKKLHNFLRDKMSLKETLKPELVAAILLALKDKAFAKGYTVASKKELVRNCKQAIENILDKAGIPDEKQRKMLGQIETVLDETAVSNNLLEAIQMIDDIMSLALTSDAGVDVLGDLYSEFIRYSGGDGSGLGIVLTPQHITELFCDLANLNPNSSVVYDPCCGSAGFLLAAMAYMLGKTDDPKIKERIKKQGLAGVELETLMYVLAAANMIFRGDGKSNLFNEDTLDLPEDIKKRLRAMKINVILLNPPYSQKEKDKTELDFVLKAAELAEPGATLIAIVPMSCMIQKSAKKKELMEKHTLEAVMSMPNQLFPSIGAVTCVFVIKCHQPHQEDRETWFGLWKDDNFRLLKGKRVEKHDDAWEQRKKEWISAYRKRDTVPGQSVKKVVKADDEWCAEAYLETDYSKLGESLFGQAIKDLELYLLSLKQVVIKSKLPSKDTWKPFKLRDLFDMEWPVGISQYEAEKLEGEKKYPLLAATTKDNGSVGLFPEIEGQTKYNGGKITVLANGQPGVAFYQPDDFYVANDTCVLTVKKGLEDKITPACKLFIATLITNESYRFNYGRKFRDERANLTIKLPAKKDGTPDWEDIDKFMKGLEFSRILDKLDTKLD